MKKQFLKASTLFIAIVLISTVLFSGCSSKDYSKEVLGKWYCWHWYYNIENGEDGFYEENDYLLFEINEDTFSVKKADGSIQKEGNYEWVKNGNADIYFNDGASCNVEVSFNDKGQIKLMITETKLIYVLEVD